MSESRPLRSLRHRQCPECQEIRPASAFRPVTDPPPARGQLPARRCPQCGYFGPLADFLITARAPARELS
jgi:ssDNA-binding Zn-finger/Zn-ribbon topoisomerase 1